MKKYLFLSLAMIISLALLASYSSVEAEEPDNALLEDEEFVPGFQDMQRRDIGWRFDTFKEELGLTDEQLQKLGDGRIAHQKEMIALQAQLKVAMIDMGQLMKSHSNDEAVIGKSKEINAIKTRFAELQLNHRLHQRSIFTAEQWDKVSKLTQFRGKAMHSKMGRGGGGFGQEGRHSRQPHGRSFNRSGRGFGRQLPPAPLSDK